MGRHYPAQGLSRSKPWVNLNTTILSQCSLIMLGPEAILFSLSVLDLNRVDDFPLQRGKAWTAPLKIGLDRLNYIGPGEDICGL